MRFKLQRSFGRILIPIAILLMVGPVFAVYQLTPKQTMAQIIALAEPLDAVFTGTTRTQFRQALTRFKTIYASMPDDPTAPVPCPGTWSAWTPTGTCSSCVNGSQTCSETRSFTPDPGLPAGTVCPASPEVRQVTQSCPVTPPPTGVILSGMSVIPTSVAGGSSVTITATLSGPAPGARDVMISASPPGLLTLPASIRIKETATSGSVTVTAANPTMSTSVAIAGVLDTETVTVLLTVTPGPVTPPPPPPPSGGGTHAFYDQHRMDARMIRAVSFRDPNNFKGSAQGGYSFCSTCVNAQVTLDTAWDGAKVTIDTISNSLRGPSAGSTGYQVRVPIPQYAGALLVTWDAEFDSSFLYSVHAIPNYKNWQFASSTASNPPGTTIWTEVRSMFQQASAAGQIANVDVRPYPGSTGPGSTAGNLDSLTPKAGSFVIAPNVLTRYWAYFNPIGGGIYEFTLWMADANRDPVKVYDRNQLRPNTSGFWQSWWAEFNTSWDPVKTGRPNLIAHFRNLLMLQNVTDPTPFLQKP